MGYFGNLLKGSAGSLVQGAFGSLGDNLGISDIARSKKAQAELMEKQYEMNERAANNAYARTLKMYERQLQDNSASAQRQRLEEAGLNVGLMYGAAGGGAGAAGSATTTPQAAGHGAGSGAALHQTGTIDPAAVAGVREIESRAKLNESLAKKAEAETVESGASKGKIEAETKTINELRTWITADAKEKAKSQWIDNVVKEIANEYTEEDWEGLTELESKDAETGFEIAIKKNAPIYNSLMADAIKKWKEVSKIGSEAERAAAEAALLDKKNQYYLFELALAVQKNDVEEQKASAMQIAANANAKDVDFRHGIRVNWKTILQAALDIHGAITGGVRAAAGIAQAMM